MLARAERKKAVTCSMESRPEARARSHRRRSSRVKAIAPWRSRTGRSRASSFLIRAIVLP